MEETLLTLVSVAFGALMTYIFQRLSHLEQRKSELRKTRRNLY